MSETSMIPGSGTQVSASGESLIVRMDAGVQMQVSTSPEGSGVHGIPVRVAEGQNTVVLRIDPKTLDQQKKIEEMNRNIRRHGRAY